MTLIYAWYFYVAINCIYSFYTKNILENLWISFKHNVLEKHRVRRLVLNPGSVT